MPDSKVNFTDFGRLVTPPVTRAAVAKAYKKGRLTAASVERDARGVPWIIDIELARKEWSVNADYTDAPQRATQEPEAPEGDRSISNAAERQKHWQANLAELKFREASKELVNAKELTSKFVTHVTGVRNKLLGIPTRAKSQIPTLTLQDVATLENLVREALSDIAGGDDET